MKITKCIASELKITLETKPFNPDSHRAGSWKWYPETGRLLIQSHDYELELSPADLETLGTIIDSCQKARLL